jgi:uncharacterized protein (TIGR02266 family)
VLRLHYRSAGHLLVSYCTNLSRGGLFVPAAKPLPPGTRLTLMLEIPGANDPAQVEAEVRWIRQFDAAEGPAGMGLAFEDVDDVIGESIDGIVTDFGPMRIALVGTRAMRIASQIRSLVSCRTEVFEVDRNIARTLASMDLVVVDTAGDSEEALALLNAIVDLSDPPPRLALCDLTDSSTRTRAIHLARILGVPIDAENLRATVLETITDVQAAD